MRQDVITIQFIKIMDRIWLDNGLDLRMKPYRVICTADQVGMIEAVMNSNTLSNIHAEQGGAFGPLQDGTILKYLDIYNKDKQSRDIAIENFIRSCAGYCVATYVLGFFIRFIYLIIF